MDKKLLNLLVCPQCKTKLEYDSRNQRLVCANEQLAYPIRDQIPILLASEAKSLEEPT